MSTRAHRYAVVAALCVMVVCAARAAEPVAATQQLQAKWGGFSVVVPIAWGGGENPKSQTYVLLSDVAGARIHSIKIKRHYRNEIEDALGIEAGVDTPAERLAAAYMLRRSERCAEELGRDFTGGAAQAVTVAGHAGFRAEFAFRNERGLRFRGISYGFITPDGLYTAEYLAPALYYFERDLRLFEDIVASLKTFKPKRS